MRITSFALRRCSGLLIAAFTLLALMPVSRLAAQDFPSRQLTLVVPYPPGSTSDMVARLLATKLSESMKHNVIVENRGGASTNIGTEYVSRAAPDGYTVLLQAPNIATNEFSFSKLSWKRDDFAPVSLLLRWSNVLVAGPGAEMRDFRQLMAASKEASASFNYGTPGVGSLSHLAIEMLKARTGLSMLHVSYTGTAPMITSLIGQHIHYAATNPANFMSHVLGAKHKVTPMVVLGSQRDPSIPDVPSLAEFGVNGIESYGWLGALVPAKTPPAVIEKLNAELLKALALPDVQKQLKASYLEPRGSTPEEFARFLVSENKKWGDAIRAAGIKPE
jgi:tripartite-type tricarboxylate transporter receptor subunit TctC